VTDPVVQDGWAVYTPTISQVRSGTVCYNHSGLKSMDIQSTASQTISSTIHRDAFGNQTSINGTWSGPFGYAGGFGYQQDADSGLMLLGHRYYDPSTGRFLTRDPIKDGRNWYSYGGGDGAPTGFVDPTGLQSHQIRDRHGRPLGHPGYGLPPGMGPVPTPRTGPRPLPGPRPILPQPGNPFAGGPIPRLDIEGPPIPGFEWRGPGHPGSNRGNWYNPKTKEYLHPDPKHPLHGDHWDYRDAEGRNWRIYPNGLVERKTDRKGRPQ
jgi:RHS repeat-associated protein